MKQFQLPIWQSVVLLCSGGIFFTLITQPAYAQAAPMQLYQANPQTYTYGSYSGNKNPYGFEVYSCMNPNSNYSTRHDTCEPTRSSIQGLYFWSNNVLDPNNGNTCSQVQNGGDGPYYTSDNRTMNGTGQPDSQLNMCPNGNGTAGPDFIDVTKNFDYNSAYCSNGEQVVLSPRSDPGNAVCQGLNVYTMDANPQNYSQDQRNCLMYIDDEAKVTACLNGKCSSTYFDPPINPGPKGDNLIAQAGPTNICSIFNHGDGTYNVRLEGYDTGENMYGSSSFWLTWSSYGSTYTINGHVFDDVNKNGQQDAGEPDYTGPITITSSAGTVSTSGGSYSITGIPEGQITVSFPNLPSGYLMSYPKNGPPPSFVATVGRQCSVNGTTGATCNNGNIQNLNFAITDSIPWFQSSCGDIRDDNGITDLLPLSTPPTYANIANANCDTPGISFTGDTDPDLRNGQISATEQLVGGSSTKYPEVFSSSIPLQTSYTTLLAKANNAGLSITDLATVCNLSNCILPPNLPHGIYRVAGFNNVPMDVTLNGYNFGNNNNYVFLIDGTLTINGALTIPTDQNGSTALFATTKDIIVSPSVGTAATDTSESLDGWFIAGQNFIAQSQGNCNDLRLNIGGLVVANALHVGGTFINNRDLCGYDPTDPTISFIQRLDMILRAPQFLKQQRTTSQEITP